MALRLEHGRAGLGASLVRSLNFTEIPHRMNEIWPWVCAIDAFDFADPGPLAVLLRGSDEVPPEVRPVLASIVTGARKSNLKAATKLRIPAAERMMIAGSISSLVGLAKLLARADRFDADGQPIQGPAMASDRDGVEVIEAIKELQGSARRAIQEAADELGVSEETIENLLRHLRQKISAFPEL